MYFYFCILSDLIFTILLYICKLLDEVTWLSWDQNPSSAPGLCPGSCVSSTSGNNLPVIFFLGVGIDLQLISLLLGDILWPCCSWWSASLGSVPSVEAREVSVACSAWRPHNLLCSTQSSSPSVHMKSDNFYSFLALESTNFIIYEGK